LSAYAGTIYFLLYVQSWEWKVITAPRDPRELKFKARGMADGPIP
jgi:hypothetical protein